MRILVISVVAALAGGGCFGSGCDSPIVPDDSCSDPVAAALTSLEIGAGEGADFVALPDGDIRPVAVGGQGGLMVTITLRMEGPAVPGCMAQETTLHELAGDADVGSDGEPKRTYPQGDGGFTTRTLYIRYEDWRVHRGDALRVRSRAGGQTDEVLVYLDFIGMPDAGVPDGAGPDAMLDAVADAL